MIVDASLVLYRSDPELVSATLGGLRGQGVRTVRVLVNDPGYASTDMRALLEAVTGLDVVVTGDGSNLGFAGGHNQLLADAFSQGAAHCLVVNPDLVLRPGAVEALVAEARRRGGCALVSGVLALVDRDRASVAPSRVDSTGIVWTRTCRHLDQAHGTALASLELGPASREVAAVTGALVLVPAEAHDTLVTATGEFFDADFFAYREDAELGLRAGMLGLPSVVVPTVVADHARGTPGTSRDSAVVNYLSVRNRFLIAFKYGRRHRPGSPWARSLRDLMTVLACLTVERESLPALREAWGARALMHQKRRRMLDAAGAR